MVAKRKKKVIQMDSQYVLPEVLKSLRENYFDPRMGAVRKLSQPELAEMMEMDVTSIKKMESGDALPSPAAITMLSKIHGVDLKFSHKKIHPLIAKRFEQKEGGSPLNKIPDSPRELPEV